MVKPFTGYTKQQEKAIRQALIDAHLKRDADWPDILSDITALLHTVCEGHSHPDTVLYPGDMKRRLQATLTGLEATANAYDQLGDRLQAHIEAQKQIPERCHDCEYRQWKDWAAIVSEQTGTKIGDPPLPANDPPDQRPYALGRLLDHALAAVRQALERPIHPLLAYVQNDGAPKNYALRLIVSELLEIFERATGIKPTVYASAYQTNKKNCDNTKVNVEYHGTFFPFAIACLTPAFPAQELGSTILTAYKECNPSPMKTRANQMKELNPVVKPPTRRKK
jgi:hypothetical protein